MLKIGKVQLKNNVILAPMAGYTDSPYRLLVKKISDCGLVYSEMISSEGLVRKNKKTFELLSADKEEKPVSYQMFGSKPEVMAEAALMLEENGADIIDLNFGCPEPKIVNSGSGAALMKNPKLLFDIVKKVRKKIRIPLTIKIRSGWDEKSINAPEIAVECENLGVNLIAVHPRTRSQFFSGHSDWGVIKDVKEKINIPVFGSGDITEVEEALSMINKTNCDGIMIGRGALGRPWFLGEVIHYLKTGEKLPLPSINRRLDIIIEHLNLHKDKSVEMPYMRKYFCFYLKGIANARLWRRKLMSIRFSGGYKKLVEEIRLEIEKESAEGICEKV